jgi:hypothetical protein
VFILLWSKNAARSNWVRRELESAIHKSIETGTAKVIPCCLDNTDLPPLLRDIRREDFTDPKAAMQRLVDDILGFRTRKARLMAIQEVLDELDVEWATSPGCNPLICCPKCGEEQYLRGWQSNDPHRGDLYAGIRCEKCGWSDGSEM